MDESLREALSDPRSRISFPKPASFSEAGQELPTRFSFYVEPDAGFQNNVIVQLESGTPLWLFGRAGSGKTTFVEDLCLRTRRKDAGRLARSKAVYLSTPVLRISTNIINDITQAIANAFRCSGATTEVSNSLTAGNMLVVFDDVDPTSSEQMFALEVFRERFPRNWILAISDSSLAEAKPRKFGTIAMREWGAQQLASYAKMRLTDDPAAMLLVSKVIDSGRITAISPLDAQCIIDACKSHSIYRYLEPSQIEGEDGTRVFDLFFSAITGGAGIETDTAIRALGRVSLVLLMRATTRFKIEEFPRERSIIAKLTPGLFIDGGETLSFPFHVYQEILAAEYVAMFWSEALPLLKKGPARPLIWTAVYKIATRLVTKERLPELDRVFRDLSEQ